MNSHPAFDFVRPLLEVIASERGSGVGDCIAAFNRLARERNIDLSFVAAPEQKISAVDYEARIVNQREVIVAEHWHDRLNACIWLTFPKTKRTISKLHVELGAGENNRRPRRRDVLTLFDESGVLLFCEPSLCAEFERLNQAHQWSTMFVDRRDDWLAQVKPILFGHGALEQLATNWHRGLTVKAQWVPISNDASLEAIDAFVSSQIANGAMLRENERRIPLPLLGVPRWFAENEMPTCYDDVGVFRPARDRD